MFIATNLYSQSITSEETESWYKSQLGIGLTYSGSACVAMIIERSGPSTTIAQIRAQLPDRPNETQAKFDSILKVLNLYDVHYEWLLGLSKWNGEGILLLEVNPYYIPEASYEYNGMHYILVVGENEDSFTVNDPMVGSPIRYYSKDGIRNARFNYIIWIP